MPELRDIDVQNLMDINKGAWDDDVLDELFNDRDRQLIRRIPIPGRSRCDSWFWMLDNKGQFTVRSVYKQLQGSFDMQYKSFWHRLWSLKIPSKVACFLWRVCRGVLPTLMALVSKHVQVNVVCPWCYMDSESDVHILFECDFARTVWAMTGLQDYVLRRVNESCFDILVRVFQVVTRDQCAMIGMVCWSLWNRRNKWVWERVNGSAFGTKAAAVNLLVEWRRAREVDVSRRPRVENECMGWNKPSGQWVKINVDAALSRDGFVGTGAVIRDSAGHFVRARVSRVAGNWQPREAEALSLKEALSWVKELNYDYCVFESDSKQLVDACNGQEGESYFHTIVSDCVDLCKHFNHVLVQFVRRSANGVAHLLATHSMSGPREWDVHPPEFIHHVLSSDII